MSAARLQVAASATLIALIFLCLAWELWLAPLKPGGSWLALKAVFLLAPLFGILRFLQLVAAGRPRSESPTQEILRDTPFMVNIILWVIEVVAILYQLRLTGSP